MGSKNKYDFDDLLKKSLAFLEQDKGTPSLISLAEKLGVPYASLATGFRREFGISNIAQLKERKGKTEQKIEGADGEKIEVEFDGNFGEVRAVDVRGQIRTVEQLLKAAEVDVDEWEPFEPTLKKWDVVLKIKDGEHDRINVVPSFYVATRIRRRNPIAFEPVISPINLPLPQPLPKRQKKERRLERGVVKRALIVNDPQVGFRRRLHTSELTPFHDRRVLDLALQIAETEQIDHISFGGDVGDYSEWSNKFLPEPEFFWTTQPALIEQAWWLRQMRMAQKNAEMKMLAGNHDARLAIMIVSNFRQAYRLKAVDELNLPPALSVPRLLALHQLDIEYVDGYPDNGYFLNKNVFIAHGDVVRSAPGATANELSKRQAFTTIFGHIHRRELVSRRQKTNGEDQVYSAFCPGCACHVDGRVPGSKSTDQWQQGIAVVEYTEDAETIIPIAIRDGRMMYNGKQWQARERDDEINAIIQQGLEQVTE